MELPVSIRRMAGLAALLAGVAGPAAGQAPLPMDAVAPGRVEVGGTAEYTFEAPGVGVLTIAVAGDGDMVLEVRDADGQQLPEGRADADLLGSVGAEQFSVILPEAGLYRVVVDTFSGSSQIFDIAASWLAFPPYARPVDPDRRPGQAGAVDVAVDHLDSLDSDAGDAWDWFVMTPAVDGVLAVVVRATDGDIDLVLEAYTGGDGFSEPDERSDDDLEDGRGNEAVSIAVRGGQPVYVKVLGYGGAGRGGYRLSSSLIP